jgi:ABC-type arginine transport system ATPase subunit
LLIGRLHDVNTHFCYVFTWLFDDYRYNFFVHSTLALSLSKVVETIILEDEGSVELQKRVVELEEMNVQLEVSNAEMELTVSRSSEAITLLRRQLDEQLENYELLRLGNASLLEKRIEAQYRANELESELAEVWLRLHVLGDMNA